MALIIEDGTNVANADSYVTVAELQAYAITYGVTLNAGDEEMNLLKAMQYMESLDYNGLRSYSDSSLKMPRSGIYIDGYEVASTSIHKFLKSAQILAAVEYNSGNDLLATIDREIIREKIGPLETEYKPSSMSTEYYTAIQAYLAPFLKPSKMMTTR